MAASSYTYACAMPRETMADWLESTARALSFYGGVTQLIVPDNPKLPRTCRPRTARTWNGRLSA
jgi:transposase